MYCIYCGKNIDDDSSFCCYCGNDIKPKDKSRVSSGNLIGE